MVIWKSRLRCCDRRPLRRWLLVGRWGVLGGCGSIGDGSAKPRTRAQNGGWLPGRFVSVRSWGSAARDAHRRPVCTLFRPDELPMNAAVLPAFCAALPPAAVRRVCRARGSRPQATNAMPLSVNGRAACLDHPGRSPYLAQGIMRRQRAGRPSCDSAAIRRGGRTGAVDDRRGPEK